ncbi:DUF2971 domain-containing protein [Rhizobium rhizogenes]|uniref:DUF2971 domain-containing protein n=1 Tax=Rhizobium rhizogenes TaxID=359 RepID=UPI0022B6219D|nr:DUF2971 domain-containing protein [Rhizobium rhizogenes]MCZ7448144.1 DUF2971 domain-containing protein [Rhizobium rhizogenes]MCZ7465805.1 DUF2971 domain-containing protein [Rhizobium rhizogenes]
MAEAAKPPKLLYKYRAFSPRLLDMLVADELYYSDPSDFNDPLDCRPSLDADLANDRLEMVLSRLREQRALAEMQAAAKSLKYRGPKTIDHIARHSQKEAGRLLDEIRYHATDPSYDVDDPLRWLLRQYLEEELLRRYDRGIVSFGSRATCPLMWSHYGDQHNGICAAYSVPPEAQPSLHKITYGGSREVLASEVAAMDNDNEARRRVDDAVLLRKAASWGYEREWRLIGKRGVRDSPLELEEVIFGIRCKSTVKFTIVQVLSNRGRPVRFFEMREVAGTFRLKKYALDTDELTASLPRRSRLAHEMFENLD